MTSINASSANGVVRLDFIPEPGQLVEVRRRQWVVTDVSGGALSPENNGGQHLVGCREIGRASCRERV